MIEWLRPGWLLLLPAGLALLWAWWRLRAGAGPWRGLVDPELLALLAERAPARSARLGLGLALALLVLACLALAGPAWREQSAVVHRDLSARIVVLDLSPSMDAVDVAPSRLARARAAAAAVLRDAAGAQLGLVVFGADAFTVAPLMSDAEPLVHLLGGLATRTVPRAGSRPDLGLDLAREVLASAGAAAGEVILVCDSAGDERTLEAARALRAAGFPVSVLAVGTPHGGPVRLAGGTFARTEAGEIYVAKPEFVALEGVAREGGGQFRLLPSSGETPRLAHAAQAWGESRTGAAVLRQDDGAWLALLALPFAALLFRRGWLATLAFLALALPPPEAFAFDWSDLWRRADQQAAAAFARAGAGAQPRLLARLGPESPWQPMLLYRGARYAEAAARFAESDTADAHYNRGNALALADRLEEALLAYGAALERNPGMRDAIANRALVRDALARRDDWERVQPQQPGRAGSPGRSARRSGAPAGGSGARPEAGSPEVPWHEPGAPQEAGTVGASAREKPATAAKDREGSAEDAELRRLEELLAKVPDDPGAMLANRFARQQQQRGTPREDRGARW